MLFRAQLRFYYITFFLSMSILFLSFDYFQQIVSIFHFSSSIFFKFAILKSILGLLYTIRCEEDKASASNKSHKIFCTTYSDNISLSLLFNVLQHIQQKGDIMMINITYKKHGVTFNLKMSKHKLAFSTKSNDAIKYKTVLSTKQILYACCTAIAIVAFVIKSML